MPCDGLVREQHEFLDEAMRHIALGGDDVGDEAFLVQDHLRFREVEVNRAAPMASRVQDLEQLAHQLEHRHELVIFPDRLGILLRQDRD